MEVRESIGYSDGCGTAWGLKATGVVSESAVRWTGRGVRIAVLDSGMDFSHRHLARRIAATESFVRGKPVQDPLGHGTHCAGIAAGFCDPQNYRYGVAYEADLYVARVFDDVGDADIDRIVAAMDWAVSLKCDVIALPLGSIAPVQADAFEEAGARALAAKCLLIAAAGNGRDRQLALPASARRVLSVGAVDWRLRLAEFNPGANGSDTVAVDLVAPGVEVYGPTLGGAYRTRTGTSMAAAYAAGIAALWAEATGARGAALWKTLLEAAQPLPGGPAGGAVLATAPLTIKS